MKIGANVKMFFETTNEEENYDKLIKVYDSLSPIAGVIAVLTSTTEEPIVEDIETISLLKNLDEDTRKFCSSLRSVKL